ncbi:invasion associated locus B family protein [Jannaschia sp. KMU-145]|uniref:invasion associated locus B family protein n=1 Tax=Jannaschia halovivens TaxID=3388667 RepID=UPI00396B10CD
MTQRTSRIAALALATTLLATPLAAQDATAEGAAPDGPAEVANNTLFGDWLVTCEAVTVARNVCRLVQEQKLRQGDALVARLIAFPTEDGGAVLLAQVPIGVYLPGGAVFRPEDDAEADQIEMVWQRCLGDVCEAAQALDAAALEALDASGAILFGYRADVNSNPIVTRVDMTDFKTGLDALRVPE